MAMLTSTPTSTAPPARDCPDDQRRAHLYRTYGRTVFAYCRRLLGSAHAAEDAVQETFLRLNRHPDRVPRDAGELPWIYRVASNYCLNELRNAGVRRKRGDEWGALARLTGHAADPPDGPLMRELIRRLPRQLSTVAWLYFADGRDQSEIAHALGISRRTVVTRMAQFTAQARALLEEGAAATPRPREQGSRLAG
jgi:RNA polymerase sigma-70 factor (ECF subfamily)